ncbi:galactitol-1-phosphate 5-dehydrogenase [Kineosporia succinea]
MHSPGDIRVEMVPVPTPGPGEVLLEVEACGVCGSDIPRMLSAGAHRMPIICGHEFAGRVREVGPGVSGFDDGELVTVPPLIPCRTCTYCLQGQFSLCEDYDYFGSRQDGAYAQFVVSPVGNLLKVPQHLDPVAASMTDPAAIALHALWRTDMRVGKRVAVVGAGPIGLFAVQWARLSGASDVLAVDLDEKKAAMAVEAGATHTANSSDEAKDLAGAGYDIVIESAGVPAAEVMAIDITARRGEASFIGIPHETVALPKSTFGAFLRREVTLHGAWNSFSAPFPGREWTTSVERLAEGSLHWKFMVTHELGLAELPAMFQTLGSRSEFTSKVVFRPNAL